MREMGCCRQWLDPSHPNSAPSRQHLCCPAPPQAPHAPGQSGAAESTGWEVRPTPRSFTYHLKDLFHLSTNQDNKNYLLKLWLFQKEKKKFKCPVEMLALRLSAWTLGSSPLLAPSPQHRGLLTSPAPCCGELSPFRPSCSASSPLSFSSLSTPLNFSLSTSWRFVSSSRASTYKRHRGPQTKP